MKLMTHLLVLSFVFAAVALSGCEAPQPISSAPLGLPADSLVATGLKNAAFNLDQAIAIGVLRKDDPAAACVHGVLKDAGLDGDGTAPAVQSFQPRVTDLVSAGSVAYIDAQRLKAVSGMLGTIPGGCEALVGRIMIDGLKAGARVMPLPLPLGR